MSHPSCALIREGAKIGADDLVSSAIDIYILSRALQQPEGFCQNLYETDDDGWTALMYAAQNGHSNIVRKILNNTDDKENLNLINADGFTALMLAVENSQGFGSGLHILVANMLITAGADINKGSVTSALTLASEAGNEDIMNLLFNCGRPVDVNKPGIDGYTALMFAAQNGHIFAVETLIENNANVDTVNELGETAIDLAAVNLHLNIVDLLYDHGGKMSLVAFRILCVRISDMLQGASEYAGNLTAEEIGYLDFIEKVIERDPDMDIGREYDDPEFGGTHGDVMHHDVRCKFADIWHSKNLIDEFRALTPAVLGTALTEQPLPAELPAEGKYFSEIGVQGFDASNVDTELESDAKVKALYLGSSCLLLNDPEDINNFVKTPNLVVYRCGDNFKQPQGDALIKLTFPNGTSMYVGRQDLARLSISPHRKFLCQPFDSDRIFSRYVVGSCPDITSVSHCDVLDQTMHPIARIIALVSDSKDKTPARGVKRRMSTPSTVESARKSPRFQARTARRRLMPNGEGLAGGKMYGGFFHQLGRQILQGGGGMSRAEQQDLHDRMKTQYKMLRGY